MPSDLGHEQLRSERIGSTLLVSLKGQFLGGEETDVLRHLLGGLPADVETVVVDLSKVSFVNSSFLSSLLAAHTACVRRGVQLVLASVNAQIREILALTHLDRVIQIREQ